MTDKAVDIKTGALSRTMKKCETCNVDIQSSSFAKHLKTANHKEKVNPSVIPLKDTPDREIHPKIIHVTSSPPSLKLLCNEKLSPQELHTSCKNMINPYYLTNELNKYYATKVEFHHMNNLNSRVQISPKKANENPDSPKEIYIDSIKSILLQLTNIYTRIIKQNNIKFRVKCTCIYEDPKFIPVLVENIYTYFPKHEAIQIHTLGEIEEMNISDYFRTETTETEKLRSGLIFSHISLMTISFYKMKELKVGTYVELPFQSKSILNIKNKDNKCFIWSILAYLHPAENNGDRVKQYEKYIDELNIEGIEFPITLQDVKKFEKQNNINVNIFEYIEESKKLNPIHCSKNGEGVRVIDLMLYKDHFILIKKLHTFCKTSADATHLCRNCLSTYKTKDHLINHKQLCEKHSEVRYTFPYDKNFKFDKFHYKIKVPFRIYADFECLNVKDGKAVGKKTNNVYKQIPSAVGYYIISDNENILVSGYYRNFGKDCVDWFVTRMKRLDIKMKNYFKNTNIPLGMTECDENHFKDTNICWFCECIATNKVRDHDHLTGKYRGVACDKCNVLVRQKYSSFVPIFFHNFSRYDCHLFFRQLFAVKDDVKITPLPKTDEVED
jgi:hypothetical protein